MEALATSAATHLQRGPRASILPLINPLASTNTDPRSQMVCHHAQESASLPPWSSPGLIKAAMTLSSTHCPSKFLLCKPMDAQEEEKSPEYSTSSSSCSVDSASLTMETKDVDHVLHDLANNMIGRNVPFESPFGTKAQVYADFTASGKSLECIEKFIHDHVIPTYGNTHTTTSVTGRQTTAFREEARQVIHDAVNAHETKDVVLFTGQGCTSAIHKLVMALGLNKGRRCHRASKRPVIFTCPFSHHSNLLPWRESPCADEVPIPEAATGGLDLDVLEHQLQRYQHRVLKVGSFAAASNLTGMLLDVDRVSTLLHTYGALACWDYATCAPYVPMDMNPLNEPLAYKDAVFLSGHKFVGGPGSPGVLVVKKSLLRNDVPTMPGGGTVLFVTEKAHSYLTNKIEREEGGTPDILGSIRLGLAFQLKQRVGPERILKLERQHVHHVRHSLGSNANIVVLGRQTDQLPIFALLVRFGDRFLHHNFVCALLNDLFGVQARGGCQCAGPFGSRLLGLSRAHTIALGHAVIAKHEVLKPGVIRMSFPYFADESEVDYVLQAVHFVADHGWKLLPQYEFNTRTAVWRHVSHAHGACSDQKRLTDMRLDDVKTTTQSSLAIEPMRDVTTHRQQNLKLATQLANDSIQEAALSDFQQRETVATSHEELRWFAYPAEAVAAYQELGGKPPLSDEISGPIQPQRYLDPAINHIWDGVPTVATMKRHRVAMAARALIARCVPGQGSPLLMEMTPVSDSEDQSESESESDDLQKHS